MSLIPFGSIDLYENGSKFLSVEDIVHLNKTCKGFLNVRENPKMDNVYRNACIHDGIPLVEREEGEKRSVLEDLKDLYRITISGKKIGKIFGTLLGPVPKLPKKSFDDLRFNMLRNLDFFLVVEPSTIKRGEELIPWSCSNIIRLCKDPLPQPAASQPNSAYGALTWQEDVPDTSYSDRVTLHLVGMKQLLHQEELPLGMHQASSRIRLLVNSTIILSPETRDKISCLVQPKNGFETHYPFKCIQGMGIMEIPQEKTSRLVIYILDGSVPELPIPRNMSGECQDQDKEKNAPAPLSH